MREISNFTNWNNGRKIAVCEEAGELYVNDNFGISSKLINLDEWLEVYKIFFGEDEDYTLIKSEKTLFEKGVYNI